MESHSKFNNQRGKRYNPFLNYRGNQESLIHKDSSGTIWKIIKDDTSSDDTWQAPTENDVTEALCGTVATKPSTPPDCTGPNLCLYKLSDDPCEYENIRPSNRAKYRALYDLLEEYKDGTNGAIVASRKQPAEDSDADPNNFMYPTILTFPPYQYQKDSNNT